MGYAYLQAIADEALIESVGAQVNTAQALYNQASDQVKAGTSPAIDALRAHVELQTRQQQLIQAKNDFAIQKLTLARIIGLAPGQQFELTDKSPYQPLQPRWTSRRPSSAPMHRARIFRRRSPMCAPPNTLAAPPRRETIRPSLSAPTTAIAGQHFRFQSRRLRRPRHADHSDFTGGIVHGDVLEAEAQLQQARDRLENLRGQIDADVRVALLNLESASEQVAVAQSNIDLAEQSLTQSRDRFAAGVTDTVEVVQAQEAVATAHQSYISSLYSYNYAKISLARAMGAAEQGVKEYFKGK